MADNVHPFFGLPVSSEEEASSTGVPDEQSAEASVTQQLVDQPSTESQVPGGAAEDSQSDEPEQDETGADAEGDVEAGTAEMEEGEDEEEDIDLSELPPEEQEALMKLVQTLSQPLVEEQLRRQQSSYDRTINRFQQQLQQLQQELEERDRQMREIQLQGLPEEEQEKLRRVWEYEDKMKELQEREQALEDWHRELVVQTLLAEYGDYGVEREHLEQFETPEEMEAFALQVKAEALEEALREMGHRPQAASRNGRKATPKAQAPSREAQQVPAGAQAPSDTGGAAPQQAPSFKQGRGTDVMMDNFKQLPVERR